MRSVPFASLEVLLVTILTDFRVRDRKWWGGHEDGAQKRCLSSLSHSETHDQKSSHSTWKVPSLPSSVDLRFRVSAGAGSCAPELQGSRRFP